MNVLAILLAIGLHITPSDLIWRAAPPPYPAGVQIAVLQGSEYAAGTVRLRLPAGTKLSKATRARSASVTVLSGNVNVGNDAFPPGSFFVVSVFDDDITAAVDSIIQVTSDGPWLNGSATQLPGAESTVPTRSDEAELTLIDASPPSYADVTSETIIHVRVHYAVSKFVADRYHLMPMFESTRPGVTISAPVRAATTGGAPPRPYAVTAASGDITIDVPAGELLAKDRIATPLHMWIYLLRRTSEKTSEPVVRTPTMVYNVK